MASSIDPTLDGDLTAQQAVRKSELQEQLQAAADDIEALQAGTSFTGTVPVANGGTGATTAAGARTNLNVDVAGTDNSTDVTLAGAPNYLTIAGQVITRALINLASHVTGTLPIGNGGTGSTTASDARTALGLAIGSDVQAFDQGLADVAGLAVTDGNFIVGDGVNWVAESGATARASLGAAGATEYQSFAVTHTADTALATKAAGGSQMGATLSAVVVPASGFIRVTLLKCEADETGGAANGNFGFALDVGGTKVFPVTDVAAGTQTDIGITVNMGVTGAVFSTGASSATQFGFDIEDNAFPTGAQDISLFMGDALNSSTGEVTITGTTTTARFLIEVVAYD